MQGVYTYRDAVQVTERSFYGRHLSLAVYSNVLYDGSVALRW